MDWLREHSTLLSWLGGVAIASMLVPAVLLPILVVRLPPDHFVQPPSVAAPGTGRSLGQLIWRVVKNLLGAVLVLAGILLLLLPGQGILTMAVGLLLIDLPGKHKFERRIVGRPRILAAMNRLRAKFDRPPFVLGTPPPEE